RDALKRRAEKAEAEAAAALAKVQEMEDKIDELSGKSGSMDRQFERLQKQLEAANKELADTKATIEAERAGRRTASLVERLAASTKVPTTRIRGLLFAAKSDDPDLDIAPEDVDDITVKDFTKLLTKL